MRCVVAKCDKCSLMSLKAENAIIPIECDIGKLRSLFAYFQYRAPNIDSLHSPLLSVAFHDEVLDKIRKTHNRKNGEYLFCAHNADTEKEFSTQKLWGEEICNKCKRFMCKRMPNKAKRDETRKETDLECLLRHMRNSIAHGHVFVAHGGNFITVCFEDVNEKKNITARIVCYQADLIKWRKILEDAINQERGNVLNVPPNP